MKEFGGIRLPVTETLMVEVKTEMDIMDFLLDINFEKKYSAMKTLLEAKCPIMFACKCLFPVKHYPYSFDGYIMILKYPPLIWKQHRENNYALYVSRLLFGMKSYWKTKHHKCYNPVELSIITGIIQFLDEIGRYNYSYLFDK